MTTSSRVWDILVEELEASKADIPADLLLKIHRIEERVQFDRDRREAAPQIRDLVQAMLDVQGTLGSK